MKQEQSSRFSGAIAALVTPFNAKGSIDFDVYGQLIEHVIGLNVTSAVPVSVSGEFFSLSMNERMDAMRYAGNLTGDRIELIASTFSTSIGDTMKLCHLAADLNYRAAIVSTPLIGALAPDEIIEYFREIDRQVRLPIIVYNYPGRFVADVTPKLVLELLPSKNIVAYKDTSGRLDRLQEAATDLPSEIEMICGIDDLAIESYAWGARSILGGSACFLAKKHLEVLQATVFDNDIRSGVRLMGKLLPLLKLMGDSNKYIQYCKLGCELAGIAVGKPRLPLLPLSEVEKLTFTRMLGAVS